MKLLFFTRKIDKNDPRVGFVSTWIDKLSQQLDFLYILTWQKSRVEGLSPNVRLVELPPNKFIRVIILPFKLLKILPQVDGVFVHMMPLYSILAGPWCKLFNKKLVQWYTHSSVDWRLKLASLWVDEFATASTASFKLKTKKKINVLGHGINVDYFAPADNHIKSNPEMFNIITVGRISPSKDYESMIKAVYTLKEQGNGQVKLQIIGGAELPAEQSYLNSLKQIVEKLELAQQVEFVGPLQHSRILPYLQSADLFINLSQTGSLDKAVLEAMAAEVIVLTSNPAFKNLLPPDLIATNDHPQKLSQQIQKIIDLNEEQKIKLKHQLRQLVVEQHNLNNLVKKIVGLYV